MTFLRYILIASFVAYGAIAGDDDWESPVYKDLYKYRLPIPADKTPKTYAVLLFWSVAMLTVVVHTPIRQPAQL
jgi:hypothetical protein